MSKDVPAFAVVGHTNEGKSSIVATLAADEQVEIAGEARTTVLCQEFPVRVDGRAIIRLIDTPGFENARKALHWMKKHETTPDRRPEIVAAFLAEHKDDQRFAQECRLLAPILEGAGVLYVIDGSHPFRAHYTAEMEILQWTGQPRMALINDKDKGQHVEDWKRALDQFFNSSHYFNAHRSGFSNRVDLLDTLAALRPDWKDSLTEAVGYLRKDWERRRGDAADELARGLSDLLSHTETLPLGEGEKVPEKKRNELEQHFHDTLRKRETALRNNVQKLYGLASLERDEDHIGQPAFDGDLFAEETWRALGLTTRQLMLTGALAGALSGGSIDIALGGHSFMLGAAIGSLVGGFSAAYLVSQRMDSAKELVDALRGDRVLRIGPHQNPQLPWILLDRALLHYQAVCRRSHSNRAPLALGGEEQRVVTNFSSERRKGLDGIFKKLRESGSEALPPELRTKLAELILPALVELDEA